MLTETTQGDIRISRSAAPGRSRACPDLWESVASNGVPMTFSRNSEVFGEGEPADYVYKVVHGAVRTYKILSDGRRQICAFYVPGDIVGLDSGDEHSLSAEAITDAMILMIRRSALVKAAQKDSRLAHDLWIATASELRRSQAHALLLIKSARERLAAFLLDMEARLPGRGSVDLPMSRQDIADYLGLTIETVSRTLTSFSAADTIELVASRHIVLRNPSALSRLNS